MPVSYIPSAEQLVDRQKTTAKKRRRNQNAEIDELAQLLPVKLVPVVSQSIGGVLDFDGLGASLDKTLPIDKISVLRIVSTFLKFQEFVKDGFLCELGGLDFHHKTAIKERKPFKRSKFVRVYHGRDTTKKEITQRRKESPEVMKPFTDSPLSGDKRKGSGSGASMFGDMMTEALDGFLLVLDKAGTILFVSESIASYLGLTQNDVIGLNLKDITHPDDAEIIEDNLVAKNALPSGIINKGKDTQPRQFYLRIKSTMSPGRIQLSRFVSYTRVQVTGSLKVSSCKDPTSRTKPGGKDSKCGTQTSVLEVMGFVGECRLIEYTSSILELSMPQPHFTTTISLSMKIVAVESQVLDITGFSTDNFIGSRLKDYFHPADYLKLIPCEVMLMHTGHAVSPMFRFMSSTGGWIWMQMEGMLRYKPGTKERQFWEVKSKILSQEEGSLSFIEQNELYTLNPDPNQDFLNLHKDVNFLSRLSDSNQLCKDGDIKKPIVRSLTEANMSESVINAYLEGREQGLHQLPGEVKTVLHHNQVKAFKAKKLQGMAEKDIGIEVAEFPGSSMLPVESTHSADMEVGSSPPSQGAPSPTLTNIRNHTSSASGAPSGVLQHNQTTPIAPISVQNITSTTKSMPSVSVPTSNTSLITGPTTPALQTVPNLHAVRTDVPTAHVQPIPRTTQTPQDTSNFDVKANTDKSLIKTSVFDSSGFKATDASDFQSHTYSPSATPPSMPSVGVASSYTDVNQASTYPMMISNAGTGQISTECFPNFSGNTFQNSHIPVQNQFGMNQNYPVLEASFPFQSTDPACDKNPTLDFNSIPGFCDQNLNGDQVLENLLREGNEIGPGGMGVTSNYGHTHQYMREEVTMSATCQVTGAHVSMCHGGVANEVKVINGGNSEVLEILSQFS